MCLLMETFFYMLVQIKPTLLGYMLFMFYIIIDNS